MGNRDWGLWNRDSPSPTLSPNPQPPSPNCNHAALQPRHRSSPSGSNTGRSTARSRRRACRPGRKAVRARHVPLSQRRRAARRPSRGLHGHRHRLPLPAACAASSVLHPMGWDAFGLPAEQHAIKTGTPPRITTEKNIATFRRQLQDARLQLRLGPRARPRPTPIISAGRSGSFWRFSTPGSTPTQQTGRPIAELPIPDDVQPPATRRSAAIRTSTAWRTSSKRRSTGARRWAPCWPTRKSSDGMSERGGHPVVRIPLRQWMLRITAYADRLEKDSTWLDWSESDQGAAAQLDRPQHRGRGRFLHRRQIGSSDRAVPRRQFEDWAATAPSRGFPRKPADDVLRILHHAARHAVRRDVHGHRAGASVRRAADDARASRQRCEHIASRRRARAISTAPIWPRQKTGVFTGSLCDQSGQRRADADLDRRLRADRLRHRRDHGRAGPRHARLRVRRSNSGCRFAACGRSRPRADREGRRSRSRSRGPGTPFTGDGTAINSGRYDGLPTAEFKKKITARSGRRRASAARRSTTGSATGSSAGSTSGASRFRSCTNWTPDGQPTGLIRAFVRRRAAASICPR